MTIKAQEPPTIGHAAGWQVSPALNGWNWAAWGPVGSEAGLAYSYEVAQERARSALRRLTEARG